MLNLLGRKVEIADENPLPYRPEPLADLQARYPAALRRTIDPEACAIGTELRPGECRENVFDCEDGIRLIISRDAFGGGLGTSIHISASVQVNTEAYAQAARDVRRFGVPEAMDRFRNSAAVRFFEIAGHHVKGWVEFVGYSREKGVTHWIVRETSEEQTA